jgi:hypothetical protein
MVALFGGMDAPREFERTAHVLVARLPAAASIDRSEAGEFGIDFRY